MPKINIFNLTKGVSYVAVTLLFGSTVFFSGGVANKSAFPKRLNNFSLQETNEKKIVTDQWWKDSVLANSSESVLTSANSSRGEWWRWPWQSKEPKKTIKDTKNVLIIDRTGNGKSTLANVLSRTGDFKENAGSISETKEYSKAIFEVTRKNDKNNWEVIRYKVIDTIGIGDTNLSERDVLCKIAEACHEVRDGLSQVFFVTKGRFTKEEKKAYDWLREWVFDEKISNYTTIIRTSFPEFENDEICSKDKERLKKEGEKNSEILQILGECKEIIYVDNPPLVGHPKAIAVAKEIREQSRNKLINYLETSCQEIYNPQDFQKQIKKISGYITDTEKHKEEMRKLLEQSDEKNKEEIEQLKNLIEEEKEKTAKAMTDWRNERMGFFQKTGKWVDDGVGIFKEGLNCVIS